MASNTIHASAVLVGARAVLIRGPSGSGKSRLALELIAGAASKLFPVVRLVGDDRVYLTAAGGRVLVAPAPQLAGLIELRGTGIMRLPYEARAVVGLVVDLNAADADRLPEAGDITLEGVTLPRLAVPSGVAALPGLLARLTLRGSGLQERA
ncbi:MAG TPA: HPr kinase/phosphatase C-terminal domain-containing protein [Xanthobacteraceae bacterium]|nr:HPr kinase/phosphatase C-terminal domain-containing protein [Xanthobacteraceae bacterium]